MQVERFGIVKKNDNFFLKKNEFLPIFFHLQSGSLFLINTFSTKTGIRSKKKHKKKAKRIINETKKNYDMNLYFKDEHRHLH